MIRVNNIQKNYGPKIVLEDVSIDIPKNQITTIIGPNGAGKSTLLGIIARLINRDGGQVFIDGTDVLEWDNKALSQKLSILKQSNITNLKITVKDVVSFGRYPYSKGRLSKEDHKKIEEALAFVQLKDEADTFIDELSGGQRQRAFIAAILAQDTDYIMLDEPLNHLDMKYMVDTMQLLKELCDQMNKTVIIVLHDINFAAGYSDYIIALKDGVLHKQGQVKEIIESKLLEEIYELDFKIIESDGKPVCLYF